MSSVVSQFELRPDELKLDDLYNWLETTKKSYTILRKRILIMFYDQAIG